MNTPLSCTNILVVDSNYLFEVICKASEYFSSLFCTVVTRDAEYYTSSFTIEHKTRGIKQTWSSVDKGLRVETEATPEYIKSVVNMGLSLAHCATVELGLRDILLAPALDYVRSICPSNVSYDCVIFDPEHDDRHLQTEHLTSEFEDWKKVKGGAPTTYDYYTSLSKPLTRVIHQGDTDYTSLELHLKFLTQEHVNLELPYSFYVGLDRIRKQGIREHLEGKDSDYEQNREDAWEYGTVNRFDYDHEQHIKTELAGMNAQVHAVAKLPLPRATKYLHYLQKEFELESRRSQAENQLHRERRYLEEETMDHF